MSDSDLEKVVEAKLSADEQLKAAKLDVDANASKNEVTISGRSDHRITETRRLSSLRALTPASQSTIKSTSSLLPKRAYFVAAIMRRRIPASPPHSLLR
jgi:hypothetical protein